jgi:hypothetical protein
MLKMNKPTRLLIRYLTLAWCVGGMSCPSVAFVQVEDGHTLDSVAVVARRSTSALKMPALGALSWSMEGIQEMPLILGNADPMHYLQMLPGVQTNAEYDAGLHIQGSDNGHNSLSIDGVTIYNPSHLFGLFSTFNASHFKDLQLSKTANSAHMPNRIGGFVDVRSQEWSDSLHAFLSVGYISSQGTVTVPIGQRSSVTASFRASYLNGLYGPWLKIDNSEIRYKFGDYNLTWNYCPTDQDEIRLSAYRGFDQMSIDDLTQDRVRWGNEMVGLDWKHTLDADWSSRSVLQQKLYFTRYHNRLKMEDGELSLLLPSGIEDWGYHVAFTRGGWRWTLQDIFHRITPQYPQVQSLSDKDGHESKKVTHRANEVSLAADYVLFLASRWDLALGLRISDYCLFNQGNTNRWGIDPMARLRYQASYGGEWALSYVSRHQYIQQTGFSQIGLPVEFWYSTTSDMGAQRSHGITLSHSVQMFDGKWHLTTELYGKRLFHQKEYIGNVMTFFFDPDYELTDQLREGRGVNYGFNMILNKRYGRGTLWFAYSLGRALRHFHHKGRTFPASHERIHELNAVGTLHFSRRFRLGGTFVLASGAPFTAPNYFYLLNGRFVSNFGEYNANRLPPMHRLDVSMSWRLGDLQRRYRQELNFSVYNLYGHANASFYRLKLSRNQYGYRSVSLLRYPMPSVSYSIRL